MTSFFKHCTVSLQERNYFNILQNIPITLFSQIRLIFCFNILGHQEETNTTREAKSTEIVAIDSDTELNLDEGTPTVAEAAHENEQCNCFLLNDSINLFGGEVELTC